MESADQSEISDTSHERSFQAWSDLRRHQILLDADEFVTKYDLDDLRGEIRTGAILLEDPDHVEGLTDADVAALAQEKRPTPIFPNELIKEFPYVCSLGGVLWGFTEALLLHSTPGQAFRGDPFQTPLMVLDMLVKVDPTYWICRILGYWCAVPLLRYFGRRGAVYGAVGLKLAGILYTLISPTFSANWVSGTFYAMVNGMFLCIMPMYLAETSPIPARGSILLTWQLTRGLGIFYGFWIFAIGSPTPIYLLAAFLLLGIGVCFWMSPESPYWHFYRGEMRQAYKMLLKHRQITAQASRDLYMMYSFRAGDRQPSNSARRTKRHLLQALAITVILVLSWTVPAISGNLVLLSLSNMTLSDYGIPTGPFMALSIVLFGMMITLVERIGRRRLVLTCMGVMAFTLVVNMLSARAYLGGFSRWDLAIPQSVMLPYGALSILIDLYEAEVACSFGHDAIMAAIMTICGLRDLSASYLATMIVEMKGYWARWNFLAAAPLLLFLAVQLIFIFLVCVLLIETKGRSLEEIRTAFGFPIANRVAYRVRLYASYITKRASVSRREELEPFEESEYGDGLIRLQEGNIG